MMPDRTEARGTAPVQKEAEDVGVGSRVGATLGISDGSDVVELSNSRNDGEVDGTADGSKVGEDVGKADGIPGPGTVNEGTADG